jgi:hypothetical protein
MVVRPGCDTAAELDRIRKKKIWTAEDLSKLPRVRWEIPNLFPAPGVIMISGPRSSLKSYIVLSCCMSTIYERQWWDGSKLKHGMCFYITGEDEKIVGDRRIAWLQAQGLPEARQDAFRVLHVSHEAYLNGGADRINLLDRETLETLIKDLAATAEAEANRVAVVVIDPLTSLLPKLDDPTCWTLVRHLKLIANSLDCCVVTVNHTHRRHAKAYQGSHVLADSIDGDFIAERDRDHLTNGVKTGLRTRLYAERLKRGRDIDFTTDWRGTPMMMQDEDGGEQQTCAMDCIGLTDTVAVDQHAINRSWIASKIPPGRVNIAEAIKLCGWQKGGSQYRDIRDAIPLDDWIAVQLPNGHEIRELRRVKIGKGQRIECRLVTEPPKPSGADEPNPKPKLEPEAEEATRRKRTRSQFGGKPLGTLQRGTMAREEFNAALDAQLEVEARDAHGFRRMIYALRDTGSVITEEGEQVLAWLASGFETEAGRKVVIPLFTTCTTARAVLRTAAAKMKASAKARDKSKGNKPKPNGDDLGNNNCSGGGGK